MSDDRIPAGSALTDDQLTQARLNMAACYVERGADARIQRQLGSMLRERSAFLAGEAPEDDGGEARLMVLTGESGAGKTRAIRRLLLGHADLTAPAHERQRPLVRLSVRAPATLKSVGIDLLDKLGYPMSPESKEYSVWSKAVRHLAMAGTQVLWLDEFQNCSSRANVDEAIRVRDTIKSLLIGEHPIILVLTGLPEIVGFIRVDEQVRRRARFTALESFGVESAGFLKEAIGMLAQGVGLGVEEDLEVELVPRLLHAARGQLGLALEMVVDAAGFALAPVEIVDGEEVRMAPRSKLTTADFARMYEDRSDNMDFANPFLAARWHEIDPTLVGVHLPSQMRVAPQETRGAKPAKPRRGGK